MDDIESLENTIAWRLRRLDADPTDVASANAVRVLEALVTDLRQGNHAEAWTALGAVLNWLGESDAISDYTGLAADYRNSLGAEPIDGAGYILGLQAIAQSLI
jgi:hypothetical protein